MVTSGTLTKLTFLAVALAVGILGVVPAAVAQDEAHDEAATAAGDLSTGSGLRGLGLGIGAGLAVGLAGMGTGRAQAGVGAGGTGTITEKPEMLAQVLILFAIPETIVIFGFVIAILLLGNI